MPRRPWIAALSVWPGLPQIWTGQEVLGLILAALFASALNLTMVRPVDLDRVVRAGVGRVFRGLGGLSLAGGPGLHALVGLALPSLASPTEIDRLFREATESYLQGRCNEARRGLEQIVTIDDTDADALMYLGTLLVRIDQPGQARGRSASASSSKGGRSGGGRSSSRWPGWPTRPCPGGELTRPDRSVAGGQPGSASGLGRHRRLGAAQEHGEPAFPGASYDLGRARPDVRRAPFIVQLGSREARQDQDRVVR